jgi:hypothetical protein
MDSTTLSDKGEARAERSFNTIAVGFVCADAGDQRPKRSTRSRNARERLTPVGLQDRKGADNGRITRDADHEPRVTAVERRGSRVDEREERAMRTRGSMRGTPELYGLRALKHLSI